MSLRPIRPIRFIMTENGNIFYIKGDIYYSTIKLNLIHHHLSYCGTKMTNRNSIRVHYKYYRVIHPSLYYLF